MMIKWELSVIVKYIKEQQCPTQQSQLNVHFVAVLELLILSHDLHQQLSWNCICQNVLFSPEH